MDNKYKLQRIVEGLGYDKGLERTLVNGVKALSESSATETLRKFVTYQESMPDILNKVSAFITENESRPLRVIKPKVQRISRKQMYQPEPASSSRESAQKITLTKQVPAFPEISSPTVVSTGLFDLMAAYTSVMVTMIEAYSSFFRVWLPSDPNYRISVKPKIEENAGIDAVRHAIATATIAFDKMNDASRQLAEFAEANMAVAMSNTKQTAGARPKGKISS